MTLMQELEMKSLLSEALYTLHTLRANEQLQSRIKRALNPPTNAQESGRQPR